AHPPDPRRRGGRDAHHDRPRPARRRQVGHGGAGRARQRPPGGRRRVPRERRRLADAGRHGGRVPRGAGGLPRDLEAARVSGRWPSAKAPRGPWGGGPDTAYLSPVTRPRSAAALVVSAAVLFAVMALVAKRAAAHLPGPEVALIRFLIGIAVCAVASTRYR